MAVVGMGEAEAAESVGSSVAEDSGRAGSAAGAIGEDAAEQGAVGQGAADRDAGGGQIAIRECAEVALAGFRCRCRICLNKRT